jgi:RecA-family ATPase
MAILPLNITNIYQTELQPLDFVFKGFKTQTIGFLSSAGGTGKSMLALHLAFSLADTSCKYNFYPLVDEDTKRGQVAYLSLEDPQDVLEYRIKAITQHIGDYNTIDTINQNLFIYSLYGTNYKLFNEKGEINNKIYKNLLELGKTSRLLIIDTFRRLHNFDENNNGAMSELLSILETICNQTKTTILLLHHQNKSAINEKSNNQTAMRGASALVDNARLVINLNTLNEKEAKENNIQEDRRKEYVKVSYAKVNYSKPLDDFILARGFGGTLSLCNCKKSNIKEEKRNNKNNFLEGLKND